MHSLLTRTHINFDHTWLGIPNPPEVDHVASMVGKTSTLLFSRTPKTRLNLDREKELLWKCLSSKCNDWWLYVLCSNLIQISPTHYIFLGRRTLRDVSHTKKRFVMINCREKWNWRKGAFVIKSVWCKNVLQLWAGVCWKTQVIKVWGYEYMCS